MTESSEKAAEVRMSRKYLDLVSLINKRLNHFPAHERQGLALMLRNKAYLISDYLIDAQKSWHKMTPINRLDTAHEQLRMLVFMAHREGYFAHPLPRNLDPDISEAALNKIKEEQNKDRFSKLTVLVDEVGKMIGGWKNKIIEEEKARKEAAEAKKQAAAEGKKQ